MKDVLEYLQLLWQQAGYPEIAAVLATTAAVTSVFGKLGTMAWKSYRQRKLLRDLHPFYTSEEIQRATQYYVETKCQNVAPSKAEEPRRGYAFATREKTIPFFLKKAFKQDDCQFYIILADSGMGKTTFLINLYLRYLNQFLKPQYQIKLFPLGWPDIDQEIEDIPKDKRKNTILLLDAFDEDIQALDNYRPRLDELITKTIGFREIVFTCRTQFFPSEEEEPKETGVMRFGVNGGERIFYKLYLSPFDDKDIGGYLRQRFSWLQFRKKRKAQQIVKHSPNLMVRPMLLSYIDELLQSERVYTAPYMVYAELIEKWIQREAQKVSSDRPQHYEQDLFTFSREIARNIYEQREHRQGALMIPGKEIQSFADKHAINLSEMEMKSRSLLNRNARGDYKFSHKSVLEYFLAEEVLLNTSFRQDLSFEGMDVAKAFLADMILERLTLPFFRQSGLKGSYCISEELYQDLTNITDKDLSNVLPKMTGLKLFTWEDSEDVLLFKGLPKLKRLEFIGDIIQADQVDDLKQEIPACQVAVNFKALRSQARVVSGKEFLDVFGLEPKKISDDLIVGQPREYIRNEYETRQDVVFDHVTGLTWERAGSKKRLTYQDAQEYIIERNHRKFAGYDNWRLPTIPELMSLLEPEKQSNGLYISPVFHIPKKAEYPWYWSADTGSSSVAWRVDFDVGRVRWRLLDGTLYVRAVRS